jgi:hypothetical protein
MNDRYVLCKVAQFELFSHNLPIQNSRKFL